MDSTILADAVATQDTITQLVAAVRRVGREVPGAAEMIAGVCTGHDYSAPGKPRIDWDDPAAKDALVSALVTDANALVAALKDRELEERAASAVGLLALVAGQDVEPAEGSDGTDGRWRIARRVAGDRVISVHDPEARHTRKSPENRRDGYRAHVVAARRPGSSPVSSSPRPQGKTTATLRSLASSWPARLPPAARGVSGMAIRPTAPGTCARRSARPGIPR